jgi:hypothetical protein
LADDDWSASRPGLISGCQAAVVVLFTIALLAGGLWFFLHRPLTDARVRGELQRDYPGFVVASLNYYRADAISFDAWPYDGYRFTMRSRTYPWLLLGGEYHLSGNLSGKTNSAGLLESPFSRTGMTRSQFADFAGAWRMIGANRPIIVGADSGTTAVYGDRLYNDATDAQRALIARHYQLDAIHGFLTNSGYLWMYLDAKSRKWVPLGSEKQIVAKFAR